MARNVRIINGRIIQMDKKNIRRKLFKNFKKLIHYNEIRKAYLKRKYKMVLTALHIEFTSHCNLRCQMCLSSVDYPRKRGFMDTGFFKILIDYIYARQDIYIENLNLWQGGEILLHPNFSEMLFYIKEKRNRRLPNICFLTNATLLDKKNSETILSSKTIDQIFFSVDYGNKKDFEEMRRGAKWEEVLDNINNFITMNNANNHKIKTGMFSIISLGEEMDGRFLELIKRLDFFHPRKAYNFEGSQKLNLGKHRVEDLNPKKGLCGGIENMMCVLWDGLVVPCCQDLLGRGIIGDLNKEGLLDIFYGTKRHSMIEMLKKNMRQKVELCKNCSL